MTKHTLFLTTILLLLCTALQAQSSFEVGYYTYEIISGTNSVGVTNFDTGNNGKIKEINVPSEVTYNNTKYTVVAIGERVFEGLKVGTIIIPHTIESIGDYAFSNCNKVIGFIIPNNLKTIGKGAFQGSSLTELRIPDGVKVISQDAFNGCSSLRTVTLPSYLTTIEENAFNDCAITTLTIPSTVTSIKDGAFANNDITTITSHIAADNLQPISTTAFTSPSSIDLNVPFGAKEKYAATEGWSQFNIIDLADSGNSGDSGDPDEPVVIPHFDLAVSSVGYASLYLGSNAVIPEELEVYIASEIIGEHIILEQVTGILPANTGVIVKAEEGTYAFNYTADKATAIGTNLLAGSVEEKKIYGDYYVLGVVDGVVGLYLTEEYEQNKYFTNGANKAYLETDDLSTVSKSAGFTFQFGGTTAIEETVNDTNDNVYYDLMGRRIENPTRGIYILGGKKVFVK